MTMTQSDKLVYGVEYEGTIHFDFELRLPMVADNIAALEEVGAQSNLRVNTAMYARCITKLGTIPQGEITYALLSNNLVDDDYDVLHAAVAELKKKRQALSQPSPTTDSPSLSSDRTASPSSVSPA